LPLDRLEPLGSQQVIAEDAIIKTSTSSETLYTCPTGKKAKVKIRARCTSTGAAAEARIGINSVLQGGNVNVLRWRPLTIGTASYGSSGENSVAGISNADYMMQGTWGEVDAVLLAGDAINTNQDVGTNATIDVDIDILELDG